MRSQQQPVLPSWGDATQVGQQLAFPEKFNSKAELCCYTVQAAIHNPLLNACGSTAIRHYLEIQVASQT